MLNRRGGYIAIIISMLVNKSTHCFYYFWNKLNMTEYEQLKELVNKIQSGYYLVFGSENILISDIEHLCKVYKKQGYIDGSNRMYKLLVGVEN